MTPIIDVVFTVETRNVKKLPTFNVGEKQGFYFQVWTMKERMKSTKFISPIIRTNEIIDL